MIKWLSKGINPLLIIWVLLSICMVVSNSFFAINEYISVPQHGLFDDFDAVTNSIKSHDKVFLYRLFFVLDFIWAFFLLSIIGYTIRKMNEKNIFTLGKTKISLFQLFSFFAVFAYLFDVIEGFFYLFYYDTFLSVITGIKIILYVICFLFLIYWILKKYIFTDFKSLYRFVQVAFLSLVFIVLIYLLLTAMPQGGTLIVDLFYHPLNIILFFFLLTFLAIILSHFPVYVDIWLYGRSNTVRLIKSNRGIKFLGFGIIYYSTLKSNSQEKDTYKNRKVTNLRRSLGILIYVAVFNIFLGVAARFFELSFSVIGITVLILIVTLLFYNKKGVDYINWKTILKDDESTNKQKEATVKKIVSYVKRFPLYFIGCTLLVLVTALIVFLNEWSRVSLLFLIVTLGLQMLLFIYFKISRSYLKYVFYSERLKRFNAEMFDPKIEALFKQYDPKPTRGKSWFSFQFGKLSDNIQYLQLMQLSGFISLIIIILANSIYSFASSLNPLNIILLYIIFFYSVIIITFKHILYYHRNKNSRSRYRDFFRFGIPVFTVLLFGWATYSVSLENDLHQLSLIEKKEAPLDGKVFLDAITNGNNANTSNNYFFVGSYGGGLKANLWNLLLFNELDKETNNKFLENTIAMSGVSGGAVGIGNYASLVHENDDEKIKEEKIFNIGKSNVLSNELVYLFGKDWFREYFPLIKYCGEDRSFKSMQQHAINTGMEEYNEITYTDYWLKMYRSRKGKFPALIMNTTSTSGKQGVASTVQFTDINYSKNNKYIDERVFPAADLILNFENSNKSLGYFGTVSTTNRFPLFSPTAKIKGKGSYLDGGYFENSGMLSVLELYDAIAGDSSKIYYEKINPVFINIINSEDYYIAEKVINEWGFTTKSLNESGEFTSILSTVVSIDKLPRYVSEKIKKRKFIFEPIMMPHKITYEKVKTVLNGDVDNPMLLMEYIEKHNRIIDSVLRSYKEYKYKKWGVVQPPLARVLSIPSVRYQEAMVKCHPDVIDAIARIKEYINEENTVNMKYQDSLKRRPYSRNKNTFKLE